MVDGKHTTKVARGIKKILTFNCVDYEGKEAIQIIFNHTDILYRSKYNLAQSD